MIYCNTTNIRENYDQGTVSIRGYNRLNVITTTLAIERTTVPRTGTTVTMHNHHNSVLKHLRERFTHTFWYVHLWTINDGC